VSSSLEFELIAVSGRARSGRITVRGKSALTPCFMPVATQAALKSGHYSSDLYDLGARILLANTYHLLLRPGPEVFRQVGGIHPWIDWPNLVLTDSGGYQVFCLPRDREIKEEGAWFRRYDSGQKMLLSPEVSLKTQAAINSDIRMVLDECVPSTVNRDDAARAMQLTHRWAARSKAAQPDDGSALFGIVQGTLFEDLRRESAEAIREIGFDGYAIGGLAVGEPSEDRTRITRVVTEVLPTDRPRYLMGVGTPLDLLEAVASGVDLFDCIVPNAWAQQGMAFTSRGRVQLRRGVYRLSSDPLDPVCDCPTCSKFSRSYLHHLIRTKEILGWRLVAQHNLFFYHQLMNRLRLAIEEDRFESLYQELRQKLDEPDLDHPSSKR
jgi:queuine tRNA-ribosyltransferase